ncbi:MAG: DUF3320 domain-containing protein [Magnetococcales bacterium]|nr:DUF3320 domain-containing protein [Magnetococcales bacterium]
MSIGSKLTDDSSVRLQATLIPKLNLSFYHNALSIIREIILFNEGKTTLDNVELTLSSSPPFFKSKVWHLDRLGAGQKFHLTDLDILLDGALLGRLTESEKAVANFVLKAGPDSIASLDATLELLPRNQWGGVGHMPEMVAAFVQPNDPAVDRLLKKAAETLRQHGRSSALNGYKDGSKHAWEITSAIWSAIASHGLDYALPPASFEHTGQKVRSPSQICESGLATCLDLTVLFCACLEQCGLNPLIVFSQGHAFAGVWLKEEEFSTSVVDDVTALRKRIMLQELALFETTLITHRPCPPFTIASDRGTSQLAETAEHPFELAVDIRRARMQRIKPLSSAESLLPQESAPSQGTEPVFAEAPVFPDEDSVEAETSPLGKVEDRLHRWQRKLLDLSLRNKLLNFRSGSKTITLEAPDPGRIEDLLADGHTLKLLSRPDLMEGNDPRSRIIHTNRTGEDILREHARDALLRKEIFVSLPPPDLESRLIGLYREARLSLQEGGANILFLALGFLAWTKDSKEGKKHLAPLLLIPVTLERKSVRSGFSLKLHDDEPRFNPTLLEMLKQDFKLTIPLASGELPRDDHGLDIGRIWDGVTQAVKEIEGWEVVKDVVLSTFSFAKYLMWKDLVDRTELLKQNPVVRHLIETPRETYPSPVEFPNPRQLDTLHGPEQVFCPLPADSSQLSAIMAAAKGKDFVLVGPPGTGKSQTIANLISQCLAEQKTILFVSEKMAALDVVYRRLRDVGLGEFCLELHSNRAKKLDVLAQLKQSMEAQSNTDLQEWHQEANRLQVLRNQLNQFVHHLHFKHRNGLSAFDALGIVVEGGSIHPVLPFPWHDADTHGREDLDQLRQLADRLAVNAAQIEHLASSPLSIIARGEWSPRWQEALMQALHGVASAVETVQQQANTFIRLSGLPHFLLTHPVAEGLFTLANALPQASGKDWRFVLRPDAPSLTQALKQGRTLLIRCSELRAQLAKPAEKEVLEGLRRGMELLAQHRVITAQLSVAYRPEVANLDVRQLKANLERAERSLWPFSVLRRHRVRRALSALMFGEGVLEATNDLQRLVSRLEVEEELKTLDHLQAKSDGLWQGLSTHPERVQSVLRFHVALSSAHKREDWRDEGLEEIANGKFGSIMADNLERMRQIKTIESSLVNFNYLTDKTNGAWNGRYSSEDEIADVILFQERIAEALTKLTKTPDEINVVKECLSKLLGDGNTLISITGTVGEACTGYIEAFGHFRNAMTTLEELTCNNPNKNSVRFGETLPALAEICRGLIRQQAKVRSWCAWYNCRDEAIRHGLASLVQTIEQGTISPDSTVKVFQYAYARWWLNALVDNNDILRNFVSAEHEKRIADFGSLDDHFTQLTRNFVRAGICAKIPGHAGTRGNSEWGILRNELQKKKRHLPLRELIGRIPTILPRLTPCLLMSPLSIAQHLPADTTAFDVVVFDEASQIPVWDAIGAIARGKQVVMVGDPKQLPPTSFFDRAESEADAEDVEGDMESILDECLGSGIPIHHLTWHYRSRHESLIAFSNHRYYQGKLITFPSPVTRDRAVRFHFVADGVYEKGGSRTNLAEARALVAFVVSRLKDARFINAGSTLGVVTFNAEQQRLIEDLLDEERRKDPSIEIHFAENKLEQVFVKNLESVQGDERDIICFSITYGPDRTGAVSMNFGPLNRDGGERRLNVAITRARHEMVVFSSLPPDRIDLSRTQARGVQDLKHFLDFSQKGSRALAEAVFGPLGDYESPLEKSIAHALQQKGWHIHSQVGVSSFRIDLGVVDPDASGRYLAGIECDGATYHRSATARDRDKLREQILRGLGWEILRVWSTDWWINAEDALDKLHGKLEELLDNSRNRRKAELQKQQENQTEILNDANSQQTNDITNINNAANKANNNTDQSYYIKADPSSVMAADPKAFYEPRYEDSLKKMIQSVVDTEGPIHENALALRITHIHGWTRCGHQIRDRVLNMAKELCTVTEEPVGLFFWKIRSETNQFPTFRRPAEGNEPRPLNEVALPELMALAKEMQTKGLDGETAILRMAREAGLQKLRSVGNRDRLDMAWKKASSEQQTSE